MRFATLDDLVAIGAITGDNAPSDELSNRIERLIELASAQVAAYLGIADQFAFDSMSDVQRDVIATVVTEAASARVSVSAAASVNQWPPSEQSWSTALLSPRHYRALDKQLGRPGGGTISVEVERDPNTSYLTVYPPRDPEWW